ncbi:MAG: four-helix bundle copper-binding protein [Steroidobacteraceae bacterium]
MRYGCVEATDLQSCIEACNDCAVACDHCATACLGEENVKALARCIALDIDCAEVCRTAAALMSRGSEFSAEFCELCAKVCDACAEECERHDMDHCRACAEACRRCAEECRRMAKARPTGRKRSGLEASAH